MAYHPLTPGIVSGNVFRATLTLNATQGGLAITPDYIKSVTLWNGIKRLDLTITVPSGTELISPAGSTQNALSISNFDVNRQRITLRNFGNLFGRGGAGGLRAANAGCQRTNPGAGSSGAPGGNGLFLGNRIILFNSGVIGGGGGGRGGDGATQGTGSENYGCWLQNSGCNVATNSFFCGSCGGCSRRDNNCSKNQARCRRYTNSWYFTTCSRTFTQWCPNTSGTNGANGSGIAGAAGAAASTGAGLGGANGRGIVNVVNVDTASGSILGVIRGGTV